MTVVARIAPVLRLLALLGLGLIAAACEPEREVRLNSPATDAGSMSAASLAAPDESQRESVRASRSGASRVETAARQPQPAAVPAARYYVEFRARSALSYGHTFAMFGRLNANGTLATREVAGLHPATESPLPWTIGHVLPVPSETGPSDGDLEDQYVTARHRIVMDKARYDEMLAYIRDLQARSTMWHAVFYNCNAFVGDIARHMGLSPPGNTMLFPKEYIEELSALNRRP
jgi:hypothetical protein